ncbi:MAG: Holliday junction branch migration protein RuvA [Selenomonadaceae bacterium]|nr:Holliday junction branch migration protein RuvA [Selenomonadaceae bacterium]
MIGYLNGKIKFLNGDDCILDVNGVGYKISVDAATRQDLKIGESAKFFIHTSVREDAINLYGFKNQSTFELFENLLTVNGVGAKSALGIVSKISASDFASAVARQDLNTLTKLPGVGKKSAQRLLLELKDKLKNFSGEISDAGEFQAEQISSTAIDEATDALSALGYTSSEISSVFKKAPKNSTTEQLIKFALKELSRWTD